MVIYGVNMIEYSNDKEDITLTFNQSYKRKRNIYWYCDCGRQNWITPAAQADDDYFYCICGNSVHILDFPREIIIKSLI